MAGTLRREFLDQLLIVNEHHLAPASISSAAASRTCSRRARSSAVSPAPSGYLMTLTYRAPHPVPK